MARAHRLAKRLYYEGWALKMIAAAFGVSWQAIHQWLNGTSADPEMLRSLGRRRRHDKPQGGMWATFLGPGEQRRPEPVTVEPVAVEVERWPYAVDEPVSRRRQWANHWATVSTRSLGEAGRDTSVTQQGRSRWDSV